MFQCAKSFNKGQRGLKSSLPGNFLESKFIT
jgi:hypothetical protein